MLFYTYFLLSLMVTPLGVTQGGTQWWEMGSGGREEGEFWAQEASLAG